MVGHRALGSDVEAGKVGVVLEAGGEDRRERHLVEWRNTEGVEDRATLEWCHLGGRSTRSYDACGTDDRGQRRGPRPPTPSQPALRKRHATSVAVEDATCRDRGAHLVSPFDKTETAMIPVPETRYTSAEGISVAYSVVGTAPLDLVFVPDWLTNVEMLWDTPLSARYHERLASFSRLIVFDKRGTGLSDPSALTELPTLEQWMDDVRAVSDAPVRNGPPSWASAGRGRCACSMRQRILTHVLRWSSSRPAPGPPGRGLPGPASH